MDHVSLKISAVVFEEDGKWVAQGIEYDINAQAGTISEVHQAFAETIAANVAVGLELGLEPFEGVGPAPQKYWDMYEAASITLQAEEKPLRLPHAELMPLPQPRLRLFEPNTHFEKLVAVG